MPATSNETRSPCGRSSAITLRPFWSGVTALGQLVLAGLVVITAWFFGGVLSSVQVWIFAALLLGLACCAIRQLDFRYQPSLPLATYPLLAALGLGIFQLIPWKQETQSLLTPAAARLRAAMLPGPASEDYPLGSALGVPAEQDEHPVSLYPASTRQNLVLLLLAVSAFVLGATLLNSPRARWGLCILAAVNGAALSLFGIVQMLTWNGRVFWQVLPAGGAPFASFINRNHAGGFLNLCLAGAIGMLLGAIFRQSSDRFGWDEEDSEDWGSETGHFGSYEGTFNLNSTIAIAAGCLVCITAGVLCSLSRGAILSMLVAAAITGGIVLSDRLKRQHRRPLVVWPAVVLIVAVLGLIQWVGMADKVWTRLETVLNNQGLSENRLPHWRDAIRAVPDYWPTGSGLGTYRYVYPSYSTYDQRVVYHHAENQYLEALVVGGVVGLGLILLMIGAVAVSAWRLIGNPPDPETYAFALAGIFALITQVVHSLTDFGLYMPANMILLAVFCGALSAAGARRAERRPARWFRWALSPAVVLVLLLGGMWGLGEVRAATTIEHALADTRLRAGARTTPEELVEQIEGLELALVDRSDDAEAQLRAAELWIDLYRARATLALQKEIPGVDSEFLWIQSAPEILHGRICQLARNKFLPHQLEILRCHHLIQDHLRKALEHLVRARSACPVNASAHWRLAQLSGLISDPICDGIHVERMRILAPANAELLFRGAILESQAGRTDSAAECWRQCLILAPRRIKLILPLALATFPVREVIDRIIPDSPALLLHLAKSVLTSEEQSDVQLEIARRVESSLTQSDVADADREYMLGQSLELQQRYAESTEHYLKAIRLRPEHIRWRYELALLFERQGALDRAHEQIKWCVRTATGNRQYQAMLNRINRALLEKQKS